jgi:hypothetical protein
VSAFGRTRRQAGGPYGPAATGARCFVSILARWARSTTQRRPNPPTLPLISIWGATSATSWRVGELFRSNGQVPQARSHSPAVGEGRGRVDGDLRAEAAAAQRGGAGERAQLCGARLVKARAHGGTRGELDRGHAASTSPEGTPASESRRRAPASNPPCRRGTPPGVTRIPSLLSGELLQERRTSSLDRDRRALAESEVCRNGADVCETGPRSAEREVQSAEREVQSAEREVQSAEREVQSAEREVQSAEREVQSAEREVQSAEREVQSAEREVQSGETEPRSGEREVQSAERDVQSAEREVQSGEREVQSAERDVRSAERDVQSAERDVQSAERDVRSAERDVQSAERDVQSGEAEPRSDRREVRLAKRR